MRRALLQSVAFVLIYSATVFGQERQHWLTKVDKDQPSFFELQKAFEQYWDGKDVTDPNVSRGKGWKPFKRWEWFMQNRVNDQGQLDAGALWRGIQEKYQNFPSSRRTSFKSNVQMLNSSNWTNLGPQSSIPTSGGAGRVTCITFHPTNSNIIYVGAPAGGLWKTTNGGTTWTTNTDDLASIGISSLAIDPSNANVMYLGTGDGDAGDTYAIGILKSVDGGNTWNTTGLSWDVSQTYRVSKVLVHPTNTSIVIAATSNGVYKTSNGGTSWSQVLSGNFKDLEFDSSNPAVWYAARYGNNTAQIYKSTDTGDTFTQLTSGLPTTGVYRVAIAISASSPSTLYALYCNNTDYGLYGVYKTTNSGSTWTQVKNSSTPNLLGWNSNGGDAGGQGWYDLCITVSPTDPNTLYVGGVNIWKSTNGGTSWTINAHWTGSGASYAHADHHAVEFLPGSGTTLFTGNDGGFFKTTNGGTNWTDYSNGLGIHQYYRISVAQSNPDLILGGAQDNGTDRYNGSSWNRIIGGDGMECVVSYANSNIQFGALYYGNIYRTTTGGTPTDMADPTEDGAWVTPYVLHPTTATTMYYATATRVYRSTNVTNTTPTWSALSGVLGSTSDPLTVLAVAPSNGNFLYTANSTTTWKTTNLTTYTVVTGLPGKVTAVTFDPTDANVAYATIGGFTAGSKVYKTVNGGSSWSNVSSTLPNVPANCVAVHPTTPNDIYVGTDVGVFYSSNGGSTWEDYGANLPNVVINDLEIHTGAGKIRAATYGRGLWESPLNVSTPSNSVTVTSPNGGENLTGGTSTAITWNSTGTIANVKLEYSLNAGSTWTTIIASTPNDGSEAWTVPTSATTQGLVRVSDALNAATNDISNANFTITVAPSNSVTVTAPNGGENLTGGTSTNITWTSTGTIANVMLEYSLNAGSTWTTIIASTPNDGSQAWTVPSSATTQGRVRVSDAAAPSTNDISNTNFTITLPSGGYATLPYTTGFESGLDSYWSTTSSNSFGRIEVTTANGPHSGSQHLTMDVTTSNNYAQNEAWLKLNLAGQSQVDLNFWWKEFGDETHAQDGIYFSSNGGSSFVKVQDLAGASYTNNTWNEFTLDVDALAAANGLSLTSTFVVKFQQYDNYPIATDGFAFDDISVTAVAAPTVTVTAPNGGETLAGNSSTTLTWSNTGSIANVKLEYSLNNGSTWTTISASTANDGSEAWTVPNSATTQGLVRVSDASNGSVNDASDNTFTITVAPSGGYASLPYSTGFETPLDAYWTTSSSNGFGRIQLTTANSPHSGSYHMTMDVSTNNNYAENHADLKLDLSGYTNVDLSFWWKDFGDENHANDGVYFSSNGGSTFTQVYTFTPASFGATYQQFVFDVDALCAANGLTMTNTFVVRFQQYDNYSIATDGMSFDDISVTGTTGGGGTPPITAESEDNGSSGSADGPVGTGVAVSGNVGTTSDADWYYFDVSTAGNINVTLNIGSSADLDFFLYNSSLTEVARGYTVNNPEVANYNASTGRYYVMVNGYSGATSAYTLTVNGGLAQIARGGEKTDLLPDKLTLKQNFPNPFNPTTTISYFLPEEGLTVLKIYNVMGQEVRTLYNGHRKAGLYHEVWDGRSNSGAVVSSGIYIYRLQAGATILSRKMLFQK